ncbi:MAG: hypothetical protein AB1405_17825 [Bdellovibrionota bacterium]
MDAISEFFFQHYPSQKFGTPLTFVRDVQEGLKEVFGDPERYFPAPRAIFILRPREETLQGYPVIRSPELVNKLYAYLRLEITNQVAVLRKQSGAEAVVSGREYESARTAYREELQKILEACVVNSSGQKFPEIFWLDHSLDVSDAISKVKKKVIEIDGSLGQQHGEAIKYRVFSRYVDTVDKALETVMQSLGAGSSISSEDYRSQLYRMMRDNVLCFTELPTRIFLSDLEGFVRHFLNRDWAVFTTELARFKETAYELLKKDAYFRGIIASFWPGLATGGDIPEWLFFDAKFRSILFAHPRQGAKEFSQEFRDLFGTLSKRLIQYDFIHYFRALVKRCAKAKEGDAAYHFEGDKGVQLDEAVRPFNFSHPMILDNRVHRFGLVYDITAFSQTYFDIKASSAGRERNAARQMFRFQETLATLPARFNMRFEKFLGDGAFYSSRRARPLIESAVLIQETYAKSRREGFPFNKGLRIALNWSYYYLLPLRNQAAKQGILYDFFGPGLIELTRLTSGKTSKEVEEIKELLIGHGYPIEVVHKFFGHIERVLATERSSSYRSEIENREFYVLVDEKGNLTNEGIVGTRAFVEELSHEVKPDELRILKWRSRTLAGFYSAPLARWITTRESGLVKVKGLDPFMVYEIVAFTPEQKEQGEFQEEKVPGGKTFADLVLGEDAVGHTGEYMTDQAHVVGEAEPTAEEKAAASQAAQAPPVEPLNLNPRPASGNGPKAAASAGAAPASFEIGCFVYEIEPGKGKYFVVGRYNPKSKTLENAVIEPKEVRITDKVRIAGIYRQLERLPSRPKEKIDVAQYEKDPGFKLILLGER